MAGAPKVRSQDIVCGGKSSVIPGFADNARRGDEPLFVFQSGLVATEILTTPDGDIQIAPCDLTIIGAVIKNVDAADSALMNFGTATDADLYLDAFAVASSAETTTVLSATEFAVTSIAQGARLQWNSTSMAGMHAYMAVLAIPRNA